MSGRGDAAQTRELAAAAQRLAVLADRIRQLSEQLTGIPASPAGPGERNPAPDQPAAGAAKGDGR
jgi:hypothetical protein